jgi:hypothetical protein
MENGMKLNRVTDPALLDQLNKKSRKVTDPNILSQLNQEEEVNPFANIPEPESFWSKLPKDITTGLAHAGRNAHNLPHELLQAAESSLQGIGNLFAGLPGSEETMRKRLPFSISKLAPYDPLNYAETFGLKNPPTAADLAIQKGLEYAPDVYGGAQLFGSLLKGGSSLFNAAKDLKISKLKSLFEESGLTAEQAEEALRNAEMEATHLYNKKNPESLQYTLNEAKKKAVELEGQMNMPLQSQMATVYPESTLIEPKPPSPLGEPVLTEEHRFEPLLPQAEQHLTTAAEKAAEAERNLESHFYKGYEHGTPIAETVVNRIEGIKNAKGKREGGLKQEIGSIYDTVETELKDRNVLIPRTEQLASQENEARALLEKSKNFFKNEEEFENTVKKIAAQAMPVKGGKTTLEIVSAADILSNYRSLRNLSQKLRTKAYSREVAGNKDLQADMLGRADEMQKTANNIESLLESNDLGSSLSKLKEANSRWRNEIVPLYRNSTYQTFLNKGYAPSKDLIYNLRGQGAGQQIIRDIIKNDPNLLRYALGQRYSKNPGAIHEFDELSQEFINASPETQELINAHRAATEHRGAATQRHEEAKAYDIEQNKIAEERLKERTKETKIHEAKKTQLQKSYEKAKKEYETKKASEAKARLPKPPSKTELLAREKAKAEHAKITEKITDLDKRIPDLREKAHAKTQTLEQKHKNMVALDKAIDERHKLKALIKKGGRIAIRLGKKLAKI